MHATSNTVMKGSILPIRIKGDITPPTTPEDFNIERLLVRMSLTLKHISPTRTYGYIQTQSHVPRVVNCAMAVDALACWSHEEHVQGSSRRLVEENKCR